MDFFTIRFNLLLQGCWPKPVVHEEMAQLSFSRYRFGDCVHQQIAWIVAKVFELDCYYPWCLYLYIIWAPNAISHSNWNLMDFSWWIWTMRKLYIFCLCNYIANIFAYKWIVFLFNRKKIVCKHWFITPSN